MTEYCRLNEIYKALDNKAHELSNLLHCGFGYYNGHYSRSTSGDYEMEYFPIPVLTVENLCDIEIGLNRISITTKLSRDAALSYDFEKIKTYDFEAYGVENYLDDFYITGDTMDSMIEKMMQSKEKTFFFSFYFSYEAVSDIIGEFVAFLRENGFFY